MKNSITNLWLLSLVVVFIFIFSAYLAITINYSKAFKVKNEVLDIIEKRKGMSFDNHVDTESAVIGSGNMYIPKSSIKVVNAYLYGSGYKTKGKCSTMSSSSSVDTNWYGVKKLTNTSNPPSPVISYDYPAKNNTNYYWCFRKRQTYCSGSCDTTGNNSFIYEVMFFYKMDLPILGDLFTFKVEGTTDEIYFTSDTLGCTCT